MARTRQEVAAAAARAVRQAAADGTLARRRAVVGFDGFLDSIIDVVDTRHGMGPDEYARLTTIAQYAQRVAAAAGKSTNMELVLKEERFGGNGPLMAGGLARLGMATTYVGVVGQEQRPREVHPLWAELETRCRTSGGEVVALGPPAMTDALEFDDGKLMFGKTGNLARCDWAALRVHPGVARLEGMLGGAALLGTVNWVMMGGVQGIWEGLIAEVLPRLAAPRPRVFVDLCDPAKRTDEDIAAALRTLGRMNELAPVTLGLNLAEAERIDAVSRAGGFAGRTGGATGGAGGGEAVRRAAEAIRRATGLDCVVVHPRSGAAAADARGASAWIDGPLVTRPRLSTGAGDHFNAGFALGQVLGLPLEEGLAIGVGVSGVYVRDAASPTAGRLAEFLESLPEPEA